MLELDGKRDDLTERIIARAIAVHRELGPGLLESNYEAALCVEFDDAELEYERQLVVPVQYKGRLIGEHRIDLMLEDAVVVEIKSVGRFDPVFEAQVLTYLRITGKRRGLLLNLQHALAKGWHPALRPVNSLCL